MKQMLLAIIGLVIRSKTISLLPRPKHHIRTPRKTHSSDVTPARNSFPSLKLDIISRNDMSKQCLNFINRKESTGTNTQIVTGCVKDHTPHAEMLTTRVAPVQRANVHWTKKPIDICSILCLLHPRGASQNGIRQIHWG